MIREKSSRDHRTRNGLVLGFTSVLSGAGTKSCKNKFTGVNNPRGLYALVDNEHGRYYSCYELQLKRLARARKSWKARARKKKNAIVVVVIVEGIKSTRTLAASTSKICRIKGAGGGKASEEKEVEKPSKIERGFESEPAKREAERQRYFKLFTIPARTRTRSPRCVRSGTYAGGRRKCARALLCIYAVPRFRDKRRGYGVTLFRIPATSSLVARVLL